MNVLAFDTASPLPAVALLWGGRAWEQILSTDRRASEELLPAVSSLLRCADAELAGCSRIVVCSGPGSFTGARVGLATAWGLGRALDIPVESVSTLEAMVESARAAGDERILAALDAGRGEVVIQLFDSTAVRVRAVSPPQRLPLAQAVRQGQELPVACIPEGLLGQKGRALDRLPARAAAEAVARSPRLADSGMPAAIYARASAAEEKRGAS